MLEITFNGSDQRVITALRTRGPQIVQAIARKLDSLMLQLQAKIAGEKLQGQVLQHRSGKLSGSIREIPVTNDGTLITGAVEGGGGPAWYGKLHEYGGTFPFHRKSEMMEKLTKKGKPRKGSITFPERSFMRASLEEMRGQIFDGLRAAVREELKP
jgi:phage gpG-like protein